MTVSTDRNTLTNLPTGRYPINPAYFKTMMFAAYLSDAGGGVLDLFVSAFLGAAAGSELLLESPPLSDDCLSAFEDFL